MEVEKESGDDAEDRVVHGAFVSDLAGEATEEEEAEECEGDVYEEIGQESWLVRH